MFCLALVCLIFQFFNSFALPDWICPTGNKFCFQRIDEPPRSWNEAQTRCAQMGAHLPGADHMNSLGQLWIKEKPFWTSLCFHNGRLQWLDNVNSYEERNILFLEKFLPDLMSPYIIKDQMYCYHTADHGIEPIKTLNLSLKDSQQAIGCMCVSDYRSARAFRVVTAKGHILSVSAVTEGADVDWGPVGQNRDGFVNIFPSKIASLKLKCDVKTTKDVHKPAIKIRWIRNDGYVGNFTQEVSFASEEDFIPWTGSIACEASYGNQEAIRSDEFQLVAWNTVTARLLSTCIACQLQNILEVAKIILTQFVEMEIESGKGRGLKFYIEPPVIQQTYITFIIHIQNKEINKFDFRMVRKLGQQFQLSRWAKGRSLFLPNDNFDLLLDTISPCNMASPQDSNNITWIGYLGQTVTSGNFIGGPVCLDNHGDIITRSCGLPDIRPRDQQICSTMKARQEDPVCFHGYEHVDGRCYKMTEVTSFSTAIAQCWAGWSMQPEILMPDSLSNWVQTSREWIYRTGNSASSLVWLPLRRLNTAALLQTPVWSWNTVSNRWIFQTNDWNTTVETSDESALCAAYDLGKNQIISTHCQNHLPMICSRPLLPGLSQPVSLNSQSDRVGEYFCEPGWLTHWFVVDSGICYRRFTVKEAIDADEAQEFCVRRGGHLATAPTHTKRIALEEVYAYFSNRSTVGSWIGLRNRDDSEPGAFRWVNESASENSSTYNWHPYSEFGNGYASAFHLGMWWNWPRGTKLWGLVCQKTISDWQDGLRLQLEPATDSGQEGDYTVVFTYNPKPILQDADGQDFRPNTTEIRKKQSFYSIKPFWQSDFDVVCYLRNYVRRFSFRDRGFRRQYRALVPVSSAMGSGPLTCEAWLNRPAFRFQSNTIVHRPANWYNYVIVISKRDHLYPHRQYQDPAINWSRDSSAEDLLQRLNLNRLRYFRDITSNFSIVTVSVEPKQNNTTDAENIFNYLVSFFVPSNVPQYDMLANAKRCRPEWHSDELNAETSDYESILHLLLQSCLPLIYRNDENYQFIEVRSTVACPPIHPIEAPNHREETTMKIDRLAWPTTEINRMARSIIPCLIGEHMVHRTCMGSFERGAIWGPPKITETTEIMYDATTVCQTPDFTSAKLYQLERMSLTAVASGLSTDDILRELLAEWEQPYLSAASLELTIASLSHILNAFRKQTIHLNRLLLITLMEKMVQPDKSPLRELQFLPDVLNDLIQLFSDLPVLESGGSRVRINLGEQVSIVADRSDTMLVPQSSALTIDFNSLTVVVQKGFENTGYSNALSTIVAILPFELLAVNPLTKDNSINLYKIDASDRTRSNLLGKFISGQTIVHVGLKPVVKALPISFTLAFKENEKWESLPDGTLLCARWDTSAMDLHSGWITGDCWYLGTNEYRRHLCQCHSPGIYGLFRSVGQTRTLGSALIHRLPIVINIALVTVVVTCLVIRSAFIYRRAIREMDLVEMGARLQLIIAWLAMLFFHFSQYFVPAYMVGCIVLTTLFQFFLTSAFFWQSTLLVIRRWQIHERWVHSQNACLAKFSLAVWGLSSVTIVTIPIYKWKYAHAKLIRSECWIEDPVDFGLTVTIVCLATVFSLTLNMKNICDQKELGIASTWNASDTLATLVIPLMALAGMFAITDNSWLQSSSTAIVFSLASSLTGLLWLCTFWTLIASPLVKHKFQHSNHKVVEDLQLKTIYGSSIEYLTDR